MEKNNIAELLKDCPKGMELDCTLYDNCTYEGIEDVGYIDILVKTPSGRIRLTKEGCYIRHDDNAKCVIYPKGKTTWEGFVSPCQFKDGDVIFTHANCLKVGLGNTWISIYKGKRNGGVATYVDYAEDGDGYYSDIDGDKALLCMEKDILRQRFATEEEKQKIFDAIKANGYRWNAETKTLEKLVEPKFKVGNRIKNSDNCRSSTVVAIKDNCYIIKTLDGLQHSYLTDKLPFSEQDEYELVTDKFNINTLKPFDRVLVRGNVGQKWIIDFFGFMDNDKGYPFVCVGHYVTQCIPFEGNQHLLGTTNDCDDFYKTWEK